LKKSHGRLYMLFEHGRGGIPEQSKVARSVSDEEVQPTLRIPTSEDKQYDADRRMQQHC
jgi:hypothetical protein